MISLLSFQQTQDRAWFQSFETLALARVSEQ